MSTTKITHAVYFTFGAVLPSTFTTIWLQLRTHDTRIIRRITGDPIRDIQGCSVQHVFMPVHNIPLRHHGTFHKIYMHSSARSLLHGTKCTQPSIKHILCKTIRKRWLPALCSTLRAFCQFPPFIFRLWNIYFERHCQISSSVSCLPRHYLCIHFLFSLLWLLIGTSSAAFLIPVCSCPAVLLF